MINVFSTRNGRFSLSRLMKEADYMVVFRVEKNRDYTLNGLSQINREGIDAIREAIRELEQAGYVTHTRVRNEKGQLGAADYVIHEFPVQPKPILENPTQEKPISENPTLENPMQENPTQLNKELSSKELSNTDLLNNHSIPILSTPLKEGTATPPERKGNGNTNMDAMFICHVRRHIMCLTVFPTFCTFFTFGKFIIKIRACGAPAVTVEGRCCNQCH